MIDQNFIEVFCRLSELAERCTRLESIVEDHEATIEELRYAGPAPARDLDYYEDAYGPESTWEAM